MSQTSNIKELFIRRFEQGLLDVTIEESIVIKSTVERVWVTFTDLSCWKDWNTVMKDVCSDSELLTEGGSFKCSFSPFLFPVVMEVKVERMEPHALIVWSTRKKGFLAYHEFLFQGHEKTVRVVSEERFSGLLSNGSGLLLPLKKIRNLTRIFLKDLKKASES